MLKTACAHLLFPAVKRQLNDLVKGLVSCSPVNEGFHGCCAMLPLLLWVSHARTMLPDLHHIRASCTES